MTMFMFLLLQIYVGPTDVNVPVWATATSFNAVEVPFCRGYYTSVRYEANGAGWHTDYPGADINLLVRVGELTTIRPGKAVVLRMDSPLLVQCPLLYMSDVGTMSLSYAEAAGLRGYLLRGGFLWVDDFWGSDAWDQWVRTIRLVLPEAQIITIDPSHPIFHQQYDLDGIWQMPTTGLWAMDEHGVMITSERDDDSITPHMRGMLDPRGGLVVVMTVNTDIAEGWEAAELNDNVDFFHTFSHKSYALGINVLLYALTH